MSDRDAGPEAGRALGTLLAVAAHELASPMTGILAFARYASQHSDPQGRIHELLLDIEREALRCSATIQDLLVFSRASGLEQPARARLADLVEGALAEVAASIERHRIAIEVAIAPDTPPLELQTWSVQRALVSLLSSAVDALAGSRTASPRIALRGGPDDGGVLLCLADNGPSPASAAGMRTGQALARAVLVMQGGTLTVQQSEQELSVRIWLPAAQR